MTNSLTRRIPQQITLANIVWFNNLLIEGWSYDDIDRRHGIFVSKVKILFEKYQNAINLIGLQMSEDTRGILEFLQWSGEVEAVDLVLCTYCIQYIDNEIYLLEHIEDTMYDDSDIRTFKTVFNLRTIGYTKTFFKELSLVSDYNIFGTTQDLMKAVKTVLPLNSCNQNLSYSTTDRRKTTVNYWNKLVNKFDRDCLKIAA